jgi:NAD(P)-dependent dehydrogenase (short-subunit alcohol dehydrogenase family)
MIKHYLKYYLIIAGIVSALMCTAARAETVLVTGSNRGIGFEFVKQYAKRGWTVIATARNPEKAEALKALAAKHPNITIDKLDVTKDDEIAALVAKYKGKPIDILINNAGISGGGTKYQLPHNLKYDVLYEVIKVNAVGPLKIAEAFEENVLASRRKMVMSVSSGMGSLTRVEGGFLHFYRTSKAALNMLMRVYAEGVRDKGITVGLLAPGATDTDFMANVPIPKGKPSERVAGMIAAIDKFTHEMSGSFLDWKGETVPW